MPKVHISREGDDGNGFPGGIRMSWSAVGTLVASVTLFLGVIAIFNGLFLKRLDGIEDRLKVLDDRLYRLVESGQSVDRASPSP